MHQEVQDLIDTFQRWVNDNPTGFSLVDWDDFVRGYLYGKSHLLTDIMEYVGSPEYEELIMKWETEFEDPDELLGFSVN